MVKAPAPVILNDTAPYVADVPVSAGRNDIPQMENARSTTTFTGEFIEDLSPLELENVITRSAGVSLSHAGEARTKDYSIRGFSATQLRNGFSGIQFGANAAIEPYSLERLTGDGSPYLRQTCFGCQARLRATDNPKEENENLAITA